MRDGERDQRRILAFRRVNDDENDTGGLFVLRSKKLTKTYCLKRSYVMRRWSYDDHRNHRRRTHWQP